MTFFRTRCVVLGIMIACGLTAVQAIMIRRLPETALVRGLAVGASTRSYESLTLFDAIDRTRAAGAHILEIHAGQFLSPRDKEVPVNDEMTPAQVAALRRKLGISAARLVAARVRFSAYDPANARLFQWADALDIQLLIGEPPVDQFDNLEKLIRRYNVGVAMVTAPKSGVAGRAGGVEPKGLLELLRGRDPRFGVVANVLNLVQAGIDPYQAITDLRTRLLGIQITDVSDLTPSAKPVPFGTGKFDFRRFLTQLDSESFDGYVVFDWPAAEPGFAQDLQKGVAFIGKEIDAIRRSNFLQAAARGVHPAPGFAYEVLSQGDISDPIQVSSTPDGGIWIAGRRGHLWEWSEADKTNRLITAFPVSTTAQRGLYSFAFDPQFQANRHLYVYRTPMLAVGNSNRVSRFTAAKKGDTWRVSVESERTLLDIPSARHGRQQGGGLMADPRDGSLYIGVGDNSLPADTLRVFNDPRHPSQDLEGLWGKILRIRTDGSIPADNPFRDQRAARPEIFALGLRNPFSITRDASNGRIYVGDLGYDRRQDVEEIDLMTAGANYGWPRCDGQGLDTGDGSPCKLSDAVLPWFSYPHESAAAVIVGPFISAGPPPGWPESFGYGLIHADFARRVIRFSAVDRASNAVTNTVTIASALYGGPLSMALTPKGELFVVEYTGWLGGSMQDRLSRIVPKPIQKNP